MSKIYFEVEDDEVTKHVPMPDTPYMDRVEVVITKEIFQECYKKWIKAEESEDKK